MGKKFILALMTLLIMSVSVQAQLRGFRANVSLHGNFGSGITDISSLDNFINTELNSGDYKYISDVIPAFGIGLSAGYSGRFFLADANIRLNYGAITNNRIQNQQLDKLAYLSVGVRLLKVKVVELELRAGYGVSFTDFTIVQKNNGNAEAWLESNSMIVPISATLWFGRVDSAHRRFGVSFEYLFSVGKFDNIEYKGFNNMVQNVADELSVAPQTMNVSLRYQF